MTATNPRAACATAESLLREASSAELFFAQGILEHLLALVRVELEDRYPLVPLHDKQPLAEVRP